MSRKAIFTFVLVISIVLVCSCALAISGASDLKGTYEYVVQGKGMLILDSGGKIVGTIKPDEDCLRLGFQDNAKKKIRGIEDGMAVRRRALAKVKLDARYQIIKGAKEVKLNICISDFETVKEIIGKEEPTATEILDATVFSPGICCGTVYAGHIFLTKETGRFEVGKITFGCGQCLILYAGDFDGDCDLELGFRPVVLSEPEPKDCGPCERPCARPCDRPCYGYRPGNCGNSCGGQNVNVHVDVSVSSSGGCFGYSGSHNRGGRCRSSCD